MDKIENTCTNNIQSQKLIDLGIDPMTSDNCIANYKVEFDEVEISKLKAYGYDINNIPVKDNWKRSSFTSWRELIDLYVDHYKKHKDTLLPSWSLGKLLEMINDTPNEAKHDIEILIPITAPNIYDSCIICIEHLIENNWFNKKYLTKKINER